MFQAHNIETINSTWTLLLCPSRSLWRRVWQDRVSRHNTRPARPRPRPQCTRPRPRLRSIFFLVSDRSCPTTDGLRSHHSRNDFAPRYVTVINGYMCESAWRVICSFLTLIYRQRRRKRPQLQTPADNKLLRSWFEYWFLRCSLTRCPSSAFFLFESVTVIGFPCSTHSYWTQETTTARSEVVILHRG